MRMMRASSSAFRAALLSAIVATVILAVATRASGPNDPATECLIEVTAGGSTTPSLECTDGDACDADGATNGSCTIAVEACTNVATASCAAQALKSAKVSGKQVHITLAPNGTASVCGTASVLLKLGGSKKALSKKRVLTATAKGLAKGVKDVDKISLRCKRCGSTSCVPATTSTLGPTSTTTSTSPTSPSTTSTALTTTTVASTSSTVPSTTSTSIPSTTSTSVPTTTSTSSTSTTSSSSTSSTTTTSSTTSTTVLFDFLSTAGTGTCGHTYRDTAGTVALKNLLCGNLSLGGGLSQVPDNATPGGATNRFTLSGCTGTTCNIGPTAVGSTPAGVDCTDLGCRFGLPLPISNAGLSVCVTNTFARATPSGTLDLDTGVADWDFELNSATVLTGNPAQPCPICAASVGGAACSGSPGTPCTGVCDGSPNQGAACQSKNPNGLSADCPAPAAVVGTQRCYRGDFNGDVCATGNGCANTACTGAGTPKACCTGVASGTCAPGLCAQFIGNIAISLKPLTTGTSSLSAADGLFCPKQGRCTGAVGSCDTPPFGKDCDCHLNTECASNTCDVSHKGGFNAAICLNGPNSGHPCVNNGTTAAADVANCGAGNSCRPGNLVNYCSGGANDGLGCSSAATCPAPGTCVRAGTLTRRIEEVGAAAGALTAGVAQTIHLGSSFCVAATTNPTVNSNADLPGPGATAIVGTVTLLP